MAFCGLATSFVAPDAAGPALAASSLPARSYWIEQIATGLKSPASMRWLPDGRLLVLERLGSLRIVRDGVLIDGTVKGLPASYQNGADGLREIEIDPDFSQNGLVYFLLSEGSYDGRAAAVYRGRLAGDRLTEVERIFKTKDSPPVWLNTQMPTRMMFLPDKTLVLGVGIDRKAINKVDVAQRLDSDIGKVLRINRDGSVPKDNPFVGRPDALPEIWTYGNRVVLGMCRFSDDDRIWAVEPGPRGGDEMNILIKGANYGWSRIGWGFTYENNGAESTNQTDEGVQDPKLVWTPSVTPAGLVCYQGHAFPHWGRNVFVGYLSGKAIERIKFDSQYRAVERELIGTDLDERIRDLREGPDGDIYILTDGGRLLRLHPGKPSQTEAAKVARKRVPVVTPSSDTTELGDPNIGKRLFVMRCAACHTVKGDVQGGVIGPDLAGLLGRTIGSQKGFGYSVALRGRKATGMRWNIPSLEMLLANPDVFAPGTTMSIAIEDRAERRAIMAYLDRASKTGSK